jgi:hypothetical protein
VIAAAVAALVEPFEGSTDGRAYTDVERSHGVRSVPDDCGHTVAAEENEILKPLPNAG